MRKFRTGLLLGLVAGFGLLLGCSGKSKDGTRLLNVSYDPTRELWKELNEKFTAQHQKETGTAVTIEQSHGGSGSQARAVIDGLEADVVTLALWGDTDAIRKKGLIKEGWEKRLPNHSLPYVSTIVFVVRADDPKTRDIKEWDWNTLVDRELKVITPNPKTSGNGQLSFLAAWGWALKTYQDEGKALAFVTQLYRQVPVLDSAARAATVTFAQRKIGDVHLTWENEAHLEVEEAKGELKIVYPKTSIRAEPYVTVVDDNVERKGTRELAEKYLKFLYTDEGQEVLAKHHYRPTSASILAKHAGRFPAIELLPITAVAKDWGDAKEKFFGDRGVFDQVQEAVAKSRR